MDTKALRQKILDLAIRGKLVPQDPNDEPASVLLERIRAEKQQMVKDGKLKPKDIKSDTVIFKGDDNLHYEKFSDGTVKCIEDEIPFDIPDSWVWCRLNDLALYKKGPFGSSITKAMFVPESDNVIKVYEQKNAINKSAQLGHYFISQEKYEELKGFEVFPGDIIVSCAGTIGETFVMPHDMRKGIINQALMKIHLFDSSVKAFYLMYFDNKLKTLANEQGYGMALKNIPPFSILKRYLIPIPPKAEQERILDHIKIILSNINDIDLLAGKLKNDVANAKSKILDLAIRGKLVPQDPNDEPASVLLERIRAEKEELIKQGKIKRDKKESVIFKGDDNSYYQDLPETWELVNFKDCATLISGRDLNKNEYNAESIGIPYITGASNFINENILINRWTTVPKIVSEVNDILITCKGTVGELAINKYGNIHIARQIMAIRIYKNINLEYIKFFLESIVMEIKKTANGLIPGISRDDILSLNIPLPPLAEQKRIVDEIEKIFATLDDIANQVA